MADTIISNTPSAHDSGEGTLMNIVLTVIFGAIVVGAVMMYQNGTFNIESPKPDATNINVTVPTPTPTTAPTPTE